MTLEATIIKKSILFSVILTENGDFITIKNIPRTVVGSEVSLVNIDKLTLPKYLLRIFSWSGRVKTMMQPF